MDTRITVDSIATIPAAEDGRRLIDPPHGLRRAGEGGETRCGDVLYALDGGHVARRLCGGCAPTSAGCGDVLEREAEDAGCPACGMSDWTPERAERESPRYMAALRVSPAHPIPDQPSSWCWDCRRLLAAGHDPQALSLGDAAERPGPAPTDGRPRTAVITGEPAIDLAERLGAELYSLYDVIPPHTTAETARGMVRAEPQLAPALCLAVVEEGAAAEYAEQQVFAMGLAVIRGVLARREVRGAIRGIIYAVLDASSCSDRALVTEEILDALAGVQGAASL